MRPIICDATGKRTYVSAAAAHDARRRFKKRLLKNGKDLSNVQELRGYQCEHCAGWHNTHLSLGEYKRIQRARASAGDPPPPPVR